MHHYSISGLAIASTIALPGVSALAPVGTAPDVIITCGAVPGDLGEDAVPGPNWSMSRRAFLLTVPGVARFLIEAGRAITVDPDGPIEDAVIFLIGSAFGILLHQRGQIVLHASAVRVGNHAVLFCGRSGAGKSTLAAALGQHGYPLIADDICAVAFDQPGPPLVMPGGRHLKLWQRSIGALDLAAQRGEAVRTEVEKFYVEPEAVIDESVPIGAVYALEEAVPPHVPGITRPGLPDAALLLRRGTYRPSLVKAMGQTEAYFAATAALATQAGVHHLRQVMDFAEMPATIARLHAHWDAIGLTVRDPT